MLLKVKKEIFFNLLLGILISTLYLQRSVSFLYIIPVLIYLSLIFKTNIKPLLFTIFGSFLIFFLIGFNNFKKTDRFYILSLEHQYYSYYHYFAGYIKADREKIKNSKANEELAEIEENWMNINKIDLDVAEDYLKAIYKLQERNTLVTTSDLAEQIRVSPASATGMIKKLAASNLVKYERYQGVTLTPPGEKIALEVLRHHRLLELYLAEALGVSWDKVHDEAEKWEHILSEELEDKIDEIKRKQGLLSVKQKQAEAQEKIYKTIEGLGDTSGTIETIERMEEKVENMQARSEAYQEISLESDKEILENKFAELENQSTDIDTELIELKKRAQLPAPEEKNGNKK